MGTRWGLKAKLIGSFIFVATVLGIVGSISIYNLKQIVAVYTHIATVVLTNVDATGDINAATRNITVVMTKLDHSNLDDTEIKKSEDRYQAAVDEIAAARKLYEGVSFAPGERELWDPVVVSLEKMISIGREVIDLSKTRKPEDAIKRDKLIAESYEEARNAFRSSFNKTRAFVKEQAKTESLEASRIAEQSSMLVVTFVIIGFVSALSLGIVLALSLSRSIGYIADNLAAAADGTAGASNQLSGASQQLSSGSNEAAASLEETVASLEELSSMVKQNAENAKQASHLSSMSQQGAEKGDAEIKKLIHAMSEMSSGAKKIEEIINVIDDIAFQTNLLALNAAVEAARAGEQGKGFAVVAEAVRSLAQKSAEAAKDISSLIKENAERSTNGAQVAESSGMVLKDIVSSVKKVADLNNEISAASQEQSHGISQISQAMSQLDAATQGNASSAEEVAASSEEMSAQAEELRGSAFELQQIVRGSSSTPAIATTSEAKIMKSPNLAVAHRAAPVKKSKPVPSAAAAIPFGDDEETSRNGSRGKIGNVSGF